MKKSEVGSPPRSKKNSSFKGGLCMLRQYMVRRILRFVKVVLGLVLMLLEVIKKLIDLTQ